MYGYGHGMNGWGYGLMGILMLVFLVLLIGGGVLLLGHNRSSRRGPGDVPATPTPDQILAERFARGEIDHEDYVARQAALRAHVR